MTARFAANLLVLVMGAFAGWICLGLAAGGGRLAGDGPAWESPPVAGGIRGETTRPPRLATQGG